MLTVMRKHGGKADARRAQVEAVLAEAKFRARVVRKVEEYFVGGESHIEAVGILAEKGKR